MKFVGGSRNGQDVPFHLETEAMVCKELTLLEHTQRGGWPHDAPARTPTKIERWVLRWWRWADGSKTYFMADASTPDVQVEPAARRVLTDCSSEALVRLGPCYADALPQPQVHAKR
jgi:hypothetical protein